MIGLNSPYRYLCYSPTTRWSPVTEEVLFRRLLRVNIVKAAFNPRTTPPFFCSFFAREISERKPRWTISNCCIPSGVPGADCPGDAGQPGRCRGRHVGGGPGWLPELSPTTGRPVRLRGVDQANPDSPVSPHPGGKAPDISGG